MSCINCKNCKVLYEKTNIIIDKIHLYYCTEKEIIIGKDVINGKCKDWCKKQSVYDLSDQHFEEAEQAILEMLETFEE